MRTTHPPVTPGAIIGYRKNGCPIRLIGGGAPDDDDQGGDGQDDGTGAGDGQNGHEDQDGQDGGDQPGDGGGQRGDHDPGSDDAGGHQDTRAGDDSAARTIKAIRGDLKTERTKRQALDRELAAIKQAMSDQAQATDKRNKELAKALGLPGGDEPPDPAQLARELEAARKATQDAIDASGSRERALVVENALLKQARRHGADPELLADSRSFMATLDSLDPGSEDFADDLGEAIQSAVERNPAFKVAVPAAGGTGAANAAGSGGAGGDGDGAGGGDNGGGQGNGRGKPRTTAPPARSGTGEGHNGAAGGNRQWTREDVARASAAEVKAALDAGLLAGLGMPPPKKKR